MDEVVVMKLKGVGYSELEVTVKGFRAEGAMMQSREIKL